MDQVHSITNEHKKGQHLTFEERVLIQTRLKNKWKPERIAKEIGCAPTTVRNESMIIVKRSISRMIRPTRTARRAIWSVSRSGIRRMTTESRS